MTAGSPILRIVCQYAVPLTVLVALRVFWQGHDLPGGGFIAGVLLAAAGAMALLAYGTAWAESRPWWKVSVVGLSISIGNGIVPLLAGKAFMDNTFFDAGPLHLPTAVFFDFGVMLIVTGTLMTIFVELAQEDR
jgi:multisubunit Na+/H+ antiporter MnhB subunit